MQTQLHDHAGFGASDLLEVLVAALLMLQHLVLECPNGGGAPTATSRTCGESLSGLVTWIC